MQRVKLKLLRIKLPRAFTVMFVPHTQQSMYSVKIPFGMIIAFMLLGLFSVILLVYSSVRYIHMKESMAELNALRTVNEQQGSQLQLMEDEVIALRGKMSDLEYLERDVRELLNSEPFSDRPVVVRRDNPQPSRGGGRGNEGMEKFKTTLVGFLSGGPSYSERIAEWDITFQETRSVAGELLANVEPTKESLLILQQDVAETKDYYEARPAGFPADGEISSEFGARSSPFSGRSEVHTGIDIAAEYGAPVISTGKGVVVFAGYRAGYGNTVLIRHKYGFQTFYCHNSSINVHAGQTVTRGDLIARVGSTGASTGPHLHYEVFLNGVRVDPAPYLTDTGRTAN